MPIQVNINDFYSVIYNNGPDTGSKKDLRHVGGDPDRIDVRITNRPEIGVGRILVSLSSGNGITWHKEIKAVNWEGQWVSSVFTQDSQHGPSEMTVDKTLVTSLIFDKAKFAGAHTDMYELSPLDQFRGVQLSFLWVKD